MPPGGASVCVCASGEARNLRRATPAGQTHTTPEGTVTLSDRMGPGPSPPAASSPLTLRSLPLPSSLPPHCVLLTRDEK